MRVCDRVSEVAGCSLAQRFKGFDALQMRGDVLELVGLFFVPDNFIVMMQKFCSPVAVERLIVTRQDHQAAVTVFLPNPHVFSDASIKG